MAQRFIKPLIAYLSVMLFAALTVGSAMQMAPDRSENLQTVALITAGATLADLCALDDDHSDHRCPVCNTSDQSPQKRGPATITRFSVVIEHVATRDLLRGPQHTNTHVAARAPPALV